jgi:V/A-type H+-transporting ATPase subunit F
MAHKIGVIGDKDSVLPFQIIRIRCTLWSSDREVRQSIEEMAQKNYGVIYITEQCASLSQKKH